jgi:hypothetical protein
MQLLDISIRYNPVLEAVVTYTEDLAYKQAKEADDLLAQGKYLGIYIANQPDLLKNYLHYWQYLYLFPQLHLELCLV